MCITGAERKMYLHPNMYKQLVAADHDHDLIETVKMGKYRVALPNLRPITIIMAFASETS